MGPFIEMHRKWKLEQLGDLEHKYDSLGRPLADIEREAARQRRKWRERWRIMLLRGRKIRA